jgi:hypothetical protein
MAEQTLITWLCCLGHWLRIGRWPNLDRPRTFNEKIQAFKLTRRDPALARFVDKVEIKRIVAERLGSSWVIPTLWEGRELPDHRTWPVPYVLKTNNSSGRNLFVASDAQENWPVVKARAERWLRSPHPAIKGEWLYTQIEPKILVEPLLGDGCLPPDYKFFVFAGRVEFIQYDTDRETRHVRKLYDRSWSELNTTLHYPRDPRTVDRPARLGEMIAAAEALAEGLDFVRVDLYALGDCLYFGEMTFTPGAGVERFTPPEWDYAFGALWPWADKFNP